MEVEISIYIKVFILAVFPVLFIVMERGFKLFNPGVLLSVIYFFEFGLSSLLMITDPASLWKLNYFSLSYLDDGLLFIVFVFLMFTVGFYLPIYNKHLKQLVDYFCKKIPNVNNYTLNIGNLNFVVFVYFILGWIARIIIYNLGLYYHTTVGFNQNVTEGIGVYAQYFAIAINLPVFSMVLAFIEWVKNKNYTYLVLTIFLLILEIAFALPTGSKEKVMFPLVLLFIIYSLKNKLPILLLSPILIFFVLFVFPFVGIYRQLILTTDIIGNLQDAFTIYVEVFKNFNLQTIGFLLSTIFSDRLNYSAIVLNIVHNTPDVCGYLYGFSYLNFFVALIPRILWPGKPIIAGTGNKFGREYGFISPVDYTTSVDMTWVGELFINFGWLGCLGGLFYGILYRFLYQYFLKDMKLSHLGIIMYPIALYYMIRGGEFTIQFGGLLKVLFVLLVSFYPFLKKIKTNK